MDKDVYIVGEDPVTKAVLRRIIQDYAPHLHVKGELPARGSEIKAKMQSFNKMAMSYPVIVLSDQDANYCGPAAKKKLLEGISPISSDLLVNIACDEAETWLYADRKGFANFLHVPETEMPMALEDYYGGAKKRTEISVPCKTSYHLTHFLIKHSSNMTLRKQIQSNRSCKGKEYNTAILPFIENRWNIEEARKLSYSLQGMIKRIQRL